MDGTNLTSGCAQWTVDAGNAKTGQLSTEFVVFGSDFDEYDVVQGNINLGFPMREFKVGRLFDSHTIRSVLTYDAGLLTRWLYFVRR